MTKRRRGGEREEKDKTRRMRNGKRRRIRRGKRNRRTKRKNGRRRRLRNIQILVSTCTSMRRDTSYLPECVCDC